MALELFPSRQHAAKRAENINNIRLAIFHFTDGFEVCCISILQKNPIGSIQAAPFYARKR
jgi:hypothetical protein